MISLTPEERDQLVRELSHIESKLAGVGGRLGFDLKVEDHPMIAGDREGVLRLGLAALRFALEAVPTPHAKNNTTLLDNRNVADSFSKENTFGALEIVVYSDGDFPKALESPEKRLVSILRGAFGIHKPRK